MEISESGDKATYFIEACGDVNIKHFFSDGVVDNFKGQRLQEQEPQMDTKCLSLLQLEGSLKKRKPLSRHLQWRHEIKYLVEARDYDVQGIGGGQVRVTVVEVNGRWRSYVTRKRSRGVREKQKRRINYY